MMKKNHLINLIFLILIILFILSCIPSVKASNESTVDVTTNNKQVLIDATNRSGDNLESDKYIIDTNAKMIYRVVPQTQIDTFKSNFNLPDQIKVYMDTSCTQEVTSGTIGTGMYVKNLADNNVYVISVIGDFNGDGTINQIEITNIIRHVVGLKNYQLSGAALKSADLNNDQEINIIDITILIRYIVYNKLEIPENPVMQAPTMRIISGDLGSNNWYTNDVEIRVNTNNYAGIVEKTVCKIQGPNKGQELVLEDGECFKITEDGIWTITAYNYNKAGIQSKETVLTIQKDSTKPNVATVTAKDINVDSFTLVGEGSDETSGVITYEFYLDNELISTVNTNVKQVEIPVKGKKPGIYNAYIIVKDSAGHIKKSEEIDVQTTRLTQNEIDYFEFVVTEFNVGNADGSTNGATAIISDTSLTGNSKYIMVNSEQQDVGGTVIGKLRLVCKDGTVIENLEYFPEELTINLEYFAGGSGTTFTHNNEANFFGIDLNAKGVQDGEVNETSILISDENVKENKFTISDKKLTGTKTYTRVTINSISLNGNNLQFRIIQEK